MVVPDGGDSNTLERGLEIKIFLITQKKGKRIGNGSEIPWKYD